MDNKPGTPPDKQIVANLFTECYAYHFGVHGNNTDGVKPTCVETKPAGKDNTTSVTETTSSRKRPVQAITWSDVPNNVWQNYTLGAPAVRKIPEGYVIIDMYNTSRNERQQPVRGGVLINDENYWFVKLKHSGSGHIKWVSLPLLPVAAPGGEGKGGPMSPQNYFLPPPHFAPPVLDNFCRNH